jgi:hypothetical protein
MHVYTMSKTQLHLRQDHILFCIFSAYTTSLDAI